MKKKKIVGIHLVSRVPKPTKPVIEDKIVIEPVFLKQEVDNDNTLFLKECIREIFFSILYTLEEDKNKLNTSIRVNEVIKEYKFDKNFFTKIQRDEKPVFFPMLNITSKYFKRFYDKLIFEIILEVVDENSNYSGLEKYVLNELHNLLNHRKTSIILLNKKYFDRLYIMFKDIKDSFIEQYMISNKIYYSKEDFTLEPFNLLENDVNYKVVYIIPSKFYGNEIVKLSKINPRGLMAPMIMDTKGKPLNLRIWNAVAYINNTFKTSIPLKCLVPTGTFVEDNKIVKMSNKILINCFSNLKPFKEKLNRKISLILFSLTETYYNRKLH